MVVVKYEDLSAAFDFVSFAAPMEHQAYISIDTGTIYWISELSPLEEEIPEDLETSDCYIAIPHKNDLDLGSDPCPPIRGGGIAGSVQHGGAVLSVSWRLCPIQGTPRIRGQSG